MRVKPFIILIMVAVLAVFAFGELLAEEWENMDPVAWPEVVKGVVRLGDTVSFDGSASYDPDGSIASYQWDFGDGESSEEVAPTHVYGAVGTYQVALAVWDDEEAYDTDYLTVYVNPDPLANELPVATLQVPSTGYVGEPVTFSCEPSDPDGTVDSVTWDFGDGQSAQGAVVTHTYQELRVYDWILTVTDNDGAATTYNGSIIMLDPSPNQPPEATYQAPSSGYVGESLSFSCEPSDPDGTVDSVTWDFGDGQSAQGAVASHTYKKDWLYYWTLTVIDNDGAKATYSHYVIIKPRPIVEVPEEEPEEIEEPLISETTTPVGPPPKSEEEKCPIEYKEQLLAQKTALEKQVKALEQSYKDILPLLTSVSDRLEAKEKELLALDTELKENKTALNKLDQELTDTNSQIDTTDETINKLQKQISGLEKIFAGGDEVSLRQGGDPLAGLTSGGAISFDGGSTWLVGAGNRGVERLISNLRKNNQIKKQVRELGKQLKELRKKQQKLEDRKQELEAKRPGLVEKIAEQEAQKKKLNDEGLSLAAEKADKEVERDALKKELDSLNNKIKEFNGFAKECGIRARYSLIDALNKLDFMPPADKQAAQDAFKKSASRDEQAVVDDMLQGDETRAGAVEGSAAEKLVQIMKDVSQCTALATKEVPLEKTKQEKTTQKGIEEFRVLNMKGMRGLSRETQKEVFEELTEAIGWVGQISDANDLISFIKMEDPFSYLYAKLFAGPATEAIIGKLTKWQKDGALEGWPSWMKLEYGEIWEVELTKTTSYVDIYGCRDNIWQHSYRWSSESTRLGECKYLGNKTFEYDIDFEGALLNRLIGEGVRCDFELGNVCPKAWPVAYKMAVESLLKALPGYAMSQCPTNDTLEE